MGPNLTLHPHIHCIVTSAGYTLDSFEFLRRFTIILPHRFVKIRRYGIYNHTVKRNLDLLLVPKKKMYIDDIIKLKQKTETTIERFTRLTKGGFSSTCIHR